MRTMHVFGVAAALWLLPLSLAAQNMAPVDLPQAPGAEEVEAYCSACHSLHIVAQQRLDRAGWKDVLVWMEEEQGLPPLEDEERTLILDYLATYFGRDAPR